MSPIWTVSPLYPSKKNDEVFEWVQFQNLQFLRVDSSCPLACNNLVNSWYSQYTTSYPLLVLEISEESVIVNCLKIKMTKSTSSRKEWCSEFLTRLIFPLRFPTKARCNLRMVLVCKYPGIVLFGGGCSRWTIRSEFQKNVPIIFRVDRVEGGVRGGRWTLSLQPFLLDVVGGLW